MKFNFDEYKDCKVVMHCKTFVEAKDFCEEMDKAGLTWWNGRPYFASDNWYHHKENTVYAFNDGQAGHIDFYTKNNYQILEWSDFMDKNEFTKSDLKNGDVCVLQNGTLHIAVPETNTLIGGWNEIDLDDFNDNLTHVKSKGKDIAEVYRPTKPEHCTLLSAAYTYGDHVYHADKVKLTKEEIAKKLGIDVDNLEIV